MVHLALKSRSPRKVSSKIFILSIKTSAGAKMSKSAKDWSRGKRKLLIVMINASESWIDDHKKTGSWTALICHVKQLSDFHARCIE
jgi:hypothetical protein